MDWMDHELENGEREWVPEGYWDSKPGDIFSLETDVTLYWPWVRPCWEERGPG